MFSPTLMYRINKNYELVLFIFFFEFILTREHAIYYTVQWEGKKKSKNR